MGALVRITFATIKSNKMDMKIKYLTVISTLLLSGSLMGQEQKPDRQDSKAMRPKRNGLTEEQMTAKMVSELELDEKQQKKVAKLNKKYKTLIEGEQMPEFNGHHLYVNGKEINQQ